MCTHVSSDTLGSPNESHPRTFSDNVELIQGYPYPLYRKPCGKFFYNLLVSRISISIIWWSFFRSSALIFSEKLYNDKYEAIANILLVFLNNLSEHSSSENNIISFFFSQSHTDKQRSMLQLSLEVHNNSVNSV